MVSTYKGCRIECFRDECDFLSFSIFDLDINKGYEVTSGFSCCGDTVREYMKSLKHIVDDYRLNPSDY